MASRTSQGVWTSYTITPLERPARWADKATLTPEEVKAYEDERAKAAAQYPRRGNDVGGDTWLDQGDKMLAGGQTSMVVDPPDGKVPVKPEGEKRHAGIMLAHSADSWEYMSVWDRCLTRGMPGGMFPGNNDNAYQIYQVPGYVVVLYEMIHEAHIIPLDLAPDGKSPHRLPDSVRQLNGDSHGRWDGNTLIVETTNYDGITQIATSAVQGRLRAMPMSPKTHVTEKVHAHKRIGAELRSHDRRSRYVLAPMDRPHSAERRARISRSSKSPATRAIWRLK